MENINSNKFQNLSKDMKSEIFKFLPKLNLLNSIKYINRNFLQTVIDDDLVGFIIKKKSLLRKITFFDKFLDDLYKEIKMPNLSERQFIDFCVLLMIKKLEKKEILNIMDHEITKNTINICFLAEFLKLNSQIKEINFKGCDIKYPYEDSLNKLCQIIKETKNLKIISFDNSGLIKNSQIFKLLAYSIKMNKSIHKFKLTNNNMGQDEDNILSLSDIIKNNQLIKYMDLSNNHLGHSEYMLRLALILKENKYIEKLNLSNNHIGENLINKSNIFENLFNVDSLTDLNLSCNQLKSEQIEILCRILKKENSLKNLNLSKNNLEDNSNNIDFICDLILKNKNLEKLNISENRLGIDNNNIKKLSSTLSNKDINLKKLNISQIGLEDNLNNYIEISKGLMNNESLIEINLSKNFQKGEYIKTGFKLTMESLFNNKFLKKLVIKENCLGSELDNFNILSMMLAENITLEILDIQENRMGVNTKNMELLCEGIKKNLGLKKLVISINRLYEDSQNMKFLGNAINKNKNLEIIDLSRNALYNDNKGRKYLHDGLKENNKIKIIESHDKEFEIITYFTY